MLRLRQRHAQKMIMIGAGAVVLAMAGATAYAFSYSKSGGGDVEQHFITQTAAMLVPATPGWHDIPNTSFDITAPASNSSHRLAHVTFSAESRCVNANWCAVRAVFTSGESGILYEMDPAPGANFAFDSGGQRGAHSMSRIAVLSGDGEGVHYKFKLQAQIVGGTSASVFRLDDYLTQMEVSNTPIQ